MKRVSLLRLGRRPFREAWELQLRIHDAVARGEMRDTWIVVEHDPVVTAGRNAKAEHVLASPETLLANGVDYVDIERGGDVTYHGPGQLVVYPIARLERFREVVPFVTALEDAVIGACARFGLQGERWSVHRGVYAGGNQVCAIGLAVKRMTSLHGLALNASTDLDYDRLITPCGIRERGVTSLSKELGRAVSVAEAEQALLPELERVFDLSFEPQPDAALELLERAAS
ncbi:MAG: lipoyl(octanoyl) transferase LipB [Candidatus Eremiobacteraeota bacterium]|nr:lipoyl(octanoyl) transferase LipB [Candidatus Eremiobacteraeota bacterium]